MSLAPVSKNSYTILPYKEWNSFVPRALEGSAPSLTSCPEGTNPSKIVCSSVKLPFSSFTSPEGGAYTWAAWRRGHHGADEVQAAP